MTVTSEISRVTYAGNGTVGPYPVPFTFFTTSDLGVIRRNTDGSETPFRLGADYTVDGAGDPGGGSITLTAGLTVGYSLLIYRDPPMTQDAVYVDHARFPAKSHEQALDKEIMIDQRTRDLVSRTLHTAETDTDGYGTYQAHGNRIADVGTPLVSTDAARIQDIDARVAATFGALHPVGWIPDVNSFTSVIAATASLIPSTIGFVRTLSWFGDGVVAAALWVATGTYPGHAMSFQEVGGRWFAFYGALDFLQAGGTDDDSDYSRPRNRDALIRANSYLFYAGSAAQRTLRFPNTLTGNYRFTDSPPNVLDAATLIPDPNVRIRGSFALGLNLRVTREMWMDYEDGTISYSEPLSNVYRPPAEKNLWITGGDLPRSTIIDLDASALAHEMILWPTSDTWAADTSVTASDLETVTRTVTGDSFWHCDFAPIRGGKRMNWAFSDFTGFRGAMVRTTNGFFVFYSNDTGPGFYAYKRPGAAYVQGSADWVGRAAMLSRQPRYCRWSIRVYDSRHFVVLLNGEEIIFPQDILYGDIIEAGPCIFGSAALTGAVAQEFTMMTEKEADGKGVLTILIEGDSTAAPNFGGLDIALKEALDGSLNVRAISIINRAVSGNNSGDVLNRVIALGAAGANYCILKVGRNDTQEGALLGNSLGNIGATCDALLAQFCNPVVCIPGQFYSQALAAGTGQNTTNFEKGAVLRAGLLRMCALKNIPYLEEETYQGAILSIYLATPQTIEQRLRDNIHQTPALYRIDGYHAARKILDHYCKPLTPQVTERGLPTAAGRFYGPMNGWGAGNAVFSVSGEGRVTLGGFLTAGTVGSGTLSTYLLPPNIRPKASKNYTARTLGSPVPLTIQADGNIIVGSTGSGTVDVFLDGISYEAA